MTSNVMEYAGDTERLLLETLRTMAAGRSVQSEFLPVLRQVLRHPRVRRDLQASVFRHGLPAMSDIETTFTLAIQAAHSLHRLKIGPSMMCTSIRILNCLVLRFVSILPLTFRSYTHDSE